MTIALVGSISVVYSLGIVLIYNPDRRTDPDHGASPSSRPRDVYILIQHYMVYITLYSMHETKTDKLVDLGAVIAAWTTYGTFPMTTTWGWRIPSIIQGVPALLSLCMVMLLPESPRWLVSKDRHEDALIVLSKCHGAGNRDDILVRAEIAEISDIIRIEAEAAREGISQLWSTPANRKRMFIIICVGLFGQWSGMLISALNWLGT